MSHRFKTIRRNVSAVLLGVFVWLFGATALLFSPLVAYAGPEDGAEVSAKAATSFCIEATGAGGGPISWFFPIFCPQRAAADVAETTNEKIVKPTIGAAFAIALINVAEFVTNRLAYEAAVWAASGLSGQQPLYEGTRASEGFITSFGKDVAGEALGQLSENVLDDALGIEFDLCRPPDLVTFGLQLGIKQAYQPQRPSCEFNEVVGNWSQFVANIESTANLFGSDEDSRQARNQFLLAKAAQSLSPGQNALEASIRLNFRVNEKVQEKRMSRFFEANENDFRPLTDVVTGKITTPSSVVEKNIQDKVNNPDKDDTTISADELLSADQSLWGMLGMNALSTFTNTLLSQMLNNIYKGLFKTTEDPDPFNVEGLVQDDSTSARSKFANVLATTPLQLTQYNALTEFVVCPVSGIVNRGLNNCVIDSNFMTAISRGDTGQPMTVQEAINENLLDGSRPLISPEDSSSNQDANCYQYGYCYGNLVKLRKARVIPIGWELAALKSPVSSPKTLQEVINEFDSCSAEGTIDADHPFCHLIDPDWVLTYPQSQCRATVNGEIRLNALTPGRSSVCADAPSCLSQDVNGNCTGGYGYCVQESNVWRFRGDECPEQYASCQTLKSTTTGGTLSVLANTVDHGVCSSNNAGCLWYRANKYADPQNTALDPTDDTFEWLPSVFIAGVQSNEVYATADRVGDVRYPGSDRTEYNYGINGNSESYQTYAYEDRVYFDREVKACTGADVGCTGLNTSNNLTLNYVRNGSFEIDTDNNNQPDFWNRLTDTQVAIDGDTARGDRALQITGAGIVVEQNVPISPNSFYTASFFAKADQEGASVDYRLLIYDENGNSQSLAGLSFGGDCGINNIRNDSIYRILRNPSEDDWTRYRCTFTTPSTASYATMRFGSSSNVRVDAIQLEVGETASAFTDGYSSAQQTAFLKVAPAYLNCRGLPSDPKECANYAQECRAQDVGCNLYEPHDGDPSIPAITSEIDVCPAQCVGYSAFRQQDTLYDRNTLDDQKPDFVYFIPDRAQSCNEQFVGCDSFTNVEAAAQGGESRSSFTYLRQCLTSQMATGADNAKSSSFFTWEGSDNSGYQLRSWQLLESNFDQQVLVFGNERIENSPGLAPCTKSAVHEQEDGSFTVVCEDTANWMNANIVSDSTCDEHADIFSNPDCREFFDTQGNIHYRRFSQTTTVSDSCIAYRKDDANALDCSASGGAWLADQGLCRYFGLNSESLSCPVAQVGCRAYSGNDSANVVTIFSEDFEQGTYESMEGPEGDVVLIVSNESLSAQGHSLLATPARNRPISVETAFDELDEMVSGRDVSLSFWAKGDYSDLAVSLVIDNTKLDFVDTTNLLDYQTIALNQTWKLYTLGPVSTNGVNIGENADVFVQWSGQNGSQMFLDNITIKMTGASVNRIKDSWVVPAVCDQSPDGTIRPQYYLGCEAYTDQKGTDGTFYQFTNLCREQAIGCEAFYDTQNSDSPYAQVHNARCVYSTDVNLFDGEVVNSPSDCSINGQTLCTIAGGQGYCTFSSQTILPDQFPSEGDFHVVYGPETVVTSADLPRYLVNDESKACSQTFAGCSELGRPRFNQDQTQVVGFDTVYFIDDPDNYGTQLCADKELFCDEFKHEREGNTYFKHPGDKTCEYKSNIEVNGRRIDGWFKSGTQEPCDPDFIIASETAGLRLNGDDAYLGWVGVCPSDYDMCSEFIDNVDTKNGSRPQGASYYFLKNETLEENTVGSVEKCEGRVSQKAGCAVLNNTTNSELRYNAGASYVLSTHARILLNEKDNILVDPVDCEVQGASVFSIGQPAVAEIRAKSALDSLPIESTSVNLCARRCLYQVPEGEGLSSAMAKSVTNSFFAGNRRENTFDNWVERSCLIDSDCPTLLSRQGTSVIGQCVNLAADENKLKNDANIVLKVNRARECSAWLACDSEKVSWDPEQNQYIRVCDSISLCREGKNIGGKSACTQIDKRDPVILTDDLYSSRDVNWSGYDLSGFAIPNQLPVELYDQFNVAPGGLCRGVSNGNFGAKIEGVDKAGLFTCGSVLDCGCQDVNDCAYECDTDIENDYRLVYNAGPCDSTASGDGLGAECQVGFCQETGLACSGSADCQNDLCVIGYCQASANSGGTDGGGSCATNADCAGATSASGTLTQVCDTRLSVCVDKLTSGVDREACENDASCNGGDSVCVRAVTTSEGACYNNRCLTNVVDTTGDGSADSISYNAVGPQTGYSKELVDSEDRSCRGYPETDSPMPNRVVETWTLYYNGNARLKTFAPSPNSPFSEPATFNPGYDQSQICAPGPDGKVSDECVCSYRKAVYGNGAMTRYYPIDVGAGDYVKGFCQGGDKNGSGCEDDDPCGEGARCMTLDRMDSFVGWDGYCLERDSSITLYGNPDVGEQACLTWLPVDQLTGATDLFGKFTSAGYEPQETLYCADIGTYHDIKTTGQYCAESKNQCNDEFSMNAVFDDQAYQNVDCADGYFAIMAAACDDDDLPRGAKDCSVNIGFDDYPYYCVPIHSFKTEADGNASVGTPCIPPTVQEAEGGETYDKYGFNAPDFLSKGGPNSTVIYFPHKSHWNAALNFYNDCVVSGVSREESLANYNNGKKSYTTYAACDSLVQTSAITAGDDDRYNVAWTNRLYNASNYALNSEDPKFAYSYGSALAPFGKARNLADDEDLLDMYANRVFMCEKNNGLGQQVLSAEAPQCPVEGWDLSSDLHGLKVGQDARPYYNVTLDVSEQNISDPAFCEFPDCTCFGDDSCNLNNELIRAPSVCNLPNICSGGLKNGQSCNGLYSCGQVVVEGEGIVCDTNAQCQENGLNGSCINVDADTKNCFYTCGPDPDEDGQCVGGPNDDQVCTENEDCRPFECVYNQCQIAAVAGDIVTEVENPLDGVRRLRQLFAKSVAILQFHSQVSNFQNNLTSIVDPEDWRLGEFELENTVDPSWNWDVRASGDGFNSSDSIPTAPVVRALGPCIGSKCKEGDAGRITVNDQKSGEVKGTLIKRVNVSFYAQANSNQLPIRRIVVDWGDGDGGPLPWPTNSQSPPGAQDSEGNYYMNHRGLNSSNGQEICGSDSGAENKDFGLSSSACTSSYVTFGHDYVCSPSYLASLKALGRICQYGGDRLLNSPCVRGQDECVFQPRAHVMDNWGWCTGYCPGGVDESDGCFDGGGEGDNECNVAECPGEGTSRQCPDNARQTPVNPWVNFDGAVVLKAEE